MSWTAFWREQYRLVNLWSIKMFDYVFGRFGRAEFVTFILPILSRFGFSIILHLFWTVVSWFVWIPFILRFALSIAFVVLWLPYVELRLEEGNTSDGDVQIMICQDKDGKSHVKISNMIDGETATGDETCKPSLILGGKNQERSSNDGLNEIIKKMWEVKRAAVEDFIKNIAWPEVRKIITTLPVSLELELYQISIGGNPPRFDDIQIFEFTNNEGNKNLSIDIQVFYVGDAKIVCKAKTDVLPKFKASVDNIRLDCQFRVILHGLAPTPPFVNGIQFYLLECPKLGWNLGGIGKVANLPKIDSQIRKYADDFFNIFATPHSLTMPATSLLPMLPQEITEKLAQHNLASSSKINRVVIPDIEGNGGY